jgi:hypothetical protein
MTEIIYRSKFTKADIRKYASAAGISENMVGETPDKELAVKAQRRDTLRSSLKEMIEIPKAKFTLAATEQMD